VIVAIALGAVLLFGTITPRTKDAEAFARNESSFAGIQIALQQYALVNARIPCPANGLVTSGLESIAGSACNSPSGVVPWVTLGLQQSAVVDSWGRLISYRVFDGATGFTRTGGLSLSDCQDSDVTPTIGLVSGGGTLCDSMLHMNARSDFFANKGLTVNDRGAIVANIAYVLISHGPSGLGGYGPNASGRLPLPVPATELANASAGGTYWIVDPSSGVGPGDPNHFDDVVAYARASSFVASAGIGGRSWPVSVIPTPNTVNGVQSVTTDFRVERRVLKLVVSNTFTSTDSALVTYYKLDGTQVTQTINGCGPGSGNYRFVRQLPTAGESFTKVVITTSTSNFLVQEVLACKYDDATCISSVTSPDC